MLDYRYKLNEGGGRVTKLLLKNGDELRSHIALKGHSLKSFSNLLGVNNNYLSAILKKRRHPSPMLAKKISNELDSKIEDFFYTDIVHKS
nr:helix-turn-helix transcriptional regulator [Lysinibacillus sp. HST-98]